MNERKDERRGRRGSKPGARAAAHAAAGVVVVVCGGGGGSDESMWRQAAGCRKRDLPRLLHAAQRALAARHKV